MRPTNYELLGVDRSCSQEELGAAWRVLAMQMHPDRCIGQGPEPVRQATEAFASLSSAYACLSDLRDREEYDRTLRLRGDLCAACVGRGRSYRQRGPLHRIHVVCTQCGGNGYHLPFTNERKT